MSKRRNLQHVLQTSDNDIQVIENADQQIRSLISEFEDQSSSEGSKGSLILQKIRLHHPLFKNISSNGFKYLMENSFIFKMQPGQFIYRQDAEVTPNIFFILFGSFACSKQQIGDFGSIMCVGHTFGEEILFCGEKDYLKRKESIVCKDQACVL